MHKTIDALNAAHHDVRTALQHLHVFRRSVGAQSDRGSSSKKILDFLGLLFASALEVDFAFPGLRFAIGHFGDLPNGIRWLTRQLYSEPSRSRSRRCSSGTSPASNSLAPSAER